ncbi:hypothetical protein Sjap_012089 [Stephania japonica]|uniref:Homeobox domain-containing protein n=1 Tax=Stephania japonica TaxID=461633 RepID=A0AAP0IV88_9MAGN
MDERSPECYNNASLHGLARTLEPAGRSRWTPKPEQILILESIFNSGMTNPPKDETVRIRKMLQEFGSVGDANVFYWFQNRRSRLRRQQRHAHIIMSNMMSSDGSGGMVDTNSTDHAAINSTVCSASITSSAATASTSTGGAGNICSASPCGLSSSAPQHPLHPVGINQLLLSSSNSPLTTTLHEDTMEQNHDALGFIPFDHDRGFLMGSYQRAGHVIVLINEFPTEVPSGPFDMKAMFGEDWMLVHHPSGLPLPCDPHGIIMLQPGESYFLRAWESEEEQLRHCGFRLSARRSGSRSPGVVQLEWDEETVKANARVRSLFQLPTLDVDVNGFLIN